MTQPNKSGLWLAHAATSNPPLEPPLIVILKYQKLQQLQHDQTLCYVLLLFSTTFNNVYRHITAKVASLIPVHSEVHAMQFYVIKFVNN
jgi:hypothetical protein